MSNQEQEIKNFLEETLKDLSGLTREKMYTTVNTLDSILIRCYDQKTAYKSELKKIKFELRKLLESNEDIPSLGWSLDDVKGWYKSLLESMISELNLLGMPSKNDIKIDKSINVYVNQNQTQKQIQKQSIDDFIEFIKDELTEKQNKEIKEIISEELDLEKNKLKLLDKLKEFGIDVCSNILANIFTNPTIWKGIL